MDATPTRRFVIASRPFDLQLKKPSSQPLAARAPFVLHATAFGVAFQIGCSSEALLEALRQRLPYNSQIVTMPSATAQTYALLEPASGHAFRLYVNGRKVAEHPDHEHLLDRFAAAATLHVAEHAPNLVFVHAGVVAWHGRAMLFPARSFSGKSTLVSELVRAGAVYYSDEYALIDPQGLVHPFARDLQMRTPGNHTQTSTPVEAFNGVAATIPIPIGSIYLTRHRSESTWQPSTIPTGQGILQTARHAVAFRRFPARVLASLSAALSNATAYSGPRGEAAATAAAMLAQR